VAPPPDAAVENYRTQQRISLSTLGLARRLWARLGAGDFDQAWKVLGPQMLVVLMSGQQAAVTQAGDYVPAVLDELGIDSGAEATVAGRSLIGVASDGRGLADLLYQPVVETRTALGQGSTLEQALTQGRSSLDRIVTTQVTDAGRAAESLEAVVRPSVTHYVRMLVPPSCSRCAILAGRVYKSATPFQRHPHCFPAGVVVSGPQVVAATRRWFQGELVTVRTASGQELPVTGNHPVLTERGWVPANLIHEGDYVVRGTRSQGAAALVVPDHDQMPAHIEDVWGTYGVAPLRGVPAAAEDFHGDGFGGEVDVVFPDRLLRGHLDATLAEQGQELLSAGRDATAGLPRKRKRDDPGRIGVTADLHSFFQKEASHRWAADLQTVGEAVFALPGEVGGGKPVGLRQFSPRWDAPAGSLTMESRAGYATRGKDLLLRLASQVALDRVVEVTRADWSGHVYNLTSSEGWFAANGLIVSNCDCRHIPVDESVAGDLTTDPRAAVEAGNVTGLSKADHQAILDGADPGKVVNAHRGMFTEQGAKLTREGTRTRGKPRTPRPRPETIYQLAGGDRAKAIELLAKWGYIIP
jgi:hypothetical protein